jgi:hypothetical protein
MGKKSAPAAPDYTKLAEMTSQSAQEAIDRQTAANRVNQYTPEGSSTWSKDANGNWSQTTTLSPEAQAAQASQQRIGQYKSNLAESLLPRLQQEYGQAPDWSKLSPYANVPLERQNLQATTSATGAGPQQQNINTSLMADPRLNANMGRDAGTAATSLQAYDNAYKMATSRLDPQYQQQQAQLEAKLANQGITQGSDAYQKAMDQFSRTKTDAYNQAMMGATSQAGQQAQIDYGINMGLRQEQAQEALNAANYGMGAQGQNFQQRLAAAQANNAALQGQFGMGQQALQQQLAAQQAAFGQSMQGSQYDLARQQQAFSQRQAAGSQNFNQQLQGAQFQNQQRQQQLTEMMQQRGFSLNEINAILTGTQVGMPSFAGYNTAGAAQGTDYSGAGRDSYGAQMDAYNAAQAASPLNAATSLASTGLKAYMSDARIKRDIKRVGRHPRGYGIFTYRFIGERGHRLGVIAQDVARVRPDLVVSYNGLLTVRPQALEGIDHVNLT